MVVYDARPNTYNQLSTTSDWEAYTNIVSVVSGRSAIDGNAGSAMVPSLDTAGRNAVLADGNVVIKGQLWRTDAAISTPIPAPSAQNRIDRLVLRYNRGATTSATVIQPTIITGTPAASPVIPPIQQTPTGFWDIPVSHWTAQSNGALASMVDDRRPTNDNWHDMRPLSGGLVGTTTNYAPPQYRFTDDGRWVEFAGYVALSSSGNYNNVPFYNMPPRFRPQVTYRGYYWAVTSPDMGVSNDTTPMLEVWGAGNCQFYNLPNPAANYIMCINGRYPLEDSQGFITS